MTTSYASSPLTIAPLLIRNFLTILFSLADKSLIHYSHKYKLLQILRCIVSSVFLFFLHLLHSLLHPQSPSKHENISASSRNESTVSRSLSQLLQLMSDIPVSSRKYDLVQTLADKFIDENISHGSPSLSQVNRLVLSSAFERSLSQLESAITEQGRSNVVGDLVKDDLCYVYGRVIGFVKGLLVRYGAREVGVSAEKVAAEVLWLAQKMKGSGCVDEAVWKWASAEKLGWMALLAEPRLQGSLVKVTVFLIKQAREMGMEEEEGKNVTALSEHAPNRKTKFKMLLSWLPLLCRANNGTDAPVLNAGEREELERIVEEIISTLNEKEQEQVLSIWLHHFSQCPTSDWPNLRTCYTRWFNASRHRLLLDVDDGLVK